MTDVGSVFAGCPNKPGLADGVGSNARFKSPAAAALDPQTGTLFVSDQHRIRCVTPDGVVTTYAGSKNGFSGLSNGPAREALFDTVSNLIRSERDGTVFVADFANGRIRRIAAAAADIDCPVSTLVPPASKQLDADGPETDQKFLSMIKSERPRAADKRDFKPFAAVGLTADPKTGFMYCVEHSSALSCDSIIKFDPTSGETVATLPLCCTFQGVNALLYVPYVPTVKPVLRRTASEMARDQQLLAIAKANGAGAGSGGASDSKSESVGSPPSGAIDPADTECGDDLFNDRPEPTSADSGLRPPIRRPIDRGSFFIAAKNLLFHYHYPRQLITLICRLPHKIASVAYDEINQFVYVGGYRARHLLRFPFNAQTVLPPAVPATTAAATTKSATAPTPAAATNFAPPSTPVRATQAMPPSPAISPLPPGTPIPLVGLDDEDDSGSSPPPAQSPPPPATATASTMDTKHSAGGSAAALASASKSDAPEVSSTEVTPALDPRDTVMDGFSVSDIPRPVDPNYIAPALFDDDDNPYF